MGGDCVIASQPDGFKWRRSDCGGDQIYFCQPRSPDCPPGYIWIPGAGLDSCFKFLPGVGFTTADNKMEQSISTATKVCLGDKTSLAAPDTTEQVAALAQWLKYNDRVLHGDYQDRGETPSLFLGYRFAAQSATTTGICDSCTWPDYYYSPWGPDITTTRPAIVSSSSPDKSCQIIQRKQDLTTAVQEFSCYKSEAYNENNFLGAMCEYRQCKISTTEVCVFPFKYAGRWYDKCTTAGRGDASLAAWCSLLVDSEGVHIPGNEANCPASCPATNCPIGFWPHLKTCLQVSASIPEDSPATVEDAEESCVSQGGRLYQPRSTRSLNAASVLVPRAYNGMYIAVSAWGIHAWAPQAGVSQETAIGMSYNLTELEPSLYYKDGSKVPSGLIAAKLSWTTGYPLTNDTSRTCISLQDISSLSNNDCEYADKDSRALSYICEARPSTTVAGPLDNPGKACVFPFRLSAGGAWHHSCVYDPLPDNKWNIWCPTAVDTQAEWSTSMSRSRPRNC